MFARREAKTRIRQRDWLKLAGEKIRREQVGSVPTFLSVRANKFAKWKTGFRGRSRERWGGGVKFRSVASNSIQSQKYPRSHLILKFINNITVFVGTLTV